MLIQPKLTKAQLTVEEEEAIAAAEEEKKPSELELLLANSKFSCSGFKDGYYADNSLNCQVFHYCKLFHISLSPFAINYFLFF